MENKNIKYKLYDVPTYYGGKSIPGVDNSIPGLYQMHFSCDNMKVIEKMMNGELSSEPVLNRLQKITRNHIDLLYEMQQESLWTDTADTEYTESTHKPILTNKDYIHYRVINKEDYIDHNECPSAENSEYILHYINIFFCMKNSDTTIGLFKKYERDVIGKYITVSIKEYNRFKTDIRPLLYLDELFKAAGYVRCTRDRIYNECGNKIRVLQYKPANITFKSFIHPVFRLSNTHFSETDVMAEIESYVHKTESSQDEYLNETTFKFRDETHLPYMKDEYMLSFKSDINIDYRNTEGIIYYGESVKRMLHQFAGISNKCIRRLYSDDKNIPHVILVRYDYSKINNRRYRILEYIVNKLGYRITDSKTRTDKDKIKMIFQIEPY